MTDPAVLKIFISCPGDVAEEKKALLQFIKEFNNQTEKEYNIHLQPLTWEQDARRGPGRGQKLINKLLKECDVYLGLMAAKFGGSTGLFQSGTHEEYEVAFLRWEEENFPFMRFFFKNNPAISMDKNALEQAKKVIEFRETIQPQFFYGDFNDKSDLIAKVKKELLTILPDWLKLQPAGTPITKPIPERDVLLDYRQFLHQQYDAIRIFQDKSFKLQDIYVSLRLEQNPEYWHCLGEAEFRRNWSKKKMSPRLEEVMSPAIAELKMKSEQGSGSHGVHNDLTIEQIIDSAELSVILGEAGSGKTTLFKHLVAKHRDAKSRYVPVYLPLRFWSGYNFCDPLHAFAQILRDQKMSFDYQLIPALEKKLISFWQDGKILLLLDGMDEISQEEFERACRFLNTLAPQGNKVLVSCRRSSYDPLLKGDAWWVYSINAFTRDDRYQFMQNYFGAGNPVAENLAGLVEGRARLRSLGQNPLLMGLLCYIYEKSKEGLPEERVVLYERCVEELLQRRQQQQVFGMTDFKKDFLRYIAFHFFMAKDKSQREWLPGDQVRRLLRQMIQQRPDLAPALTVEKTESFLQEVVDVNSLLMPIGADNLCFPHRSFQEYFAACYLNNSSDGRSQVVNKLCQDSFWTETICLYAGLQTNATDLVNQLGKKKQVDLAMRIIPDAARIDWDQLDTETLNWKIRRSAVERLVLPEPDRSRLEEITDVLKGILQGRQHDPNANVRYSALIALEKVGTPEAKTIVDHTHIIPPDVLQKNTPYTYHARGGKFSINQKSMPPNMILIPGSSFKLGETGEKVAPQDFFMSLFPVTNWEYRRFVEAGGYQDKQFWRHEGWQAKQENKWKNPGYWDDSRFNHDWQPVVGVSWYESEAYCNWLTQANSGKWMFRLPTEAEWELAAR